MLIENILIATIGGTIGYLAGILTKDNAKEIDINNIVKYEYMPVGEVEEVSVKDVREGKIEYKFIEGDKEGVKCSGRSYKSLRESLCIWSYCWIVVRS